MEPRSQEALTAVGSWRRHCEAERKLILDRGRGQDADQQHMAGHRLLQRPACRVNYQIGWFSAQLTRHSHAANHGANHGARYGYSCATAALHSSGRAGGRAGRSALLAVDQVASNLGTLDARSPAFLAAFEPPVGAAARSAGHRARLGMELGLGWAQGCSHAVQVRWAVPTPRRAVEKGSISPVFGAASYGKWARENAKQRRPFNATEQGLSLHTPAFRCCVRKQRSAASPSVGVALARPNHPASS